ncbi:MAG: phosphoglycerate kinase [Planctomycetota bacterium]
MSAPPASAAKTGTGLSVQGLDDLDVRGKRVLVRVDFNVPVDAQNAITDDTRIRAALPTLRAILERGGKPVLLTHFGRPKGPGDDTMRVTHIGARLQELLGSPVLKLDESIGPKVEAAIAAAPMGTTVLCENVRFHPGETKGDEALAQAFARLGDCFVGDAFGAAHRDHSSVSGVARLLPSAAGYLMRAEVDAFARVLAQPKRPLIAILGGAKISDKLSVVDNLLDRCDAVLIGGGMAYTFLAAQGLEIGKSLYEPDQLETCRAALAKAEANGVRLLLPIDHIAADRFAADADAVECGPAVVAGRMALDIGPKTRALFAKEIAGARTVVWNGPMGVFEMERFRAGTEAIAKALAKSKAYSVVGGGDSVAALHLLGLADEVDHVSTGGGASLELLEGRVLPGVAALAGTPAGNGGKASKR